MGKFSNGIKTGARAVGVSIERPVFQSFMTTVAWRNVDMAKEYAAFLSQGKPFYRFPFLRQIYLLWRIFFNSFAAARQYASFTQVFFSEHMLMNVFITLFTTVEYSAKGLVSLMLWPISPKNNQTDFQKQLAQIFEDYAKLIHHTPLYNYRYFSKIIPLWQAFWHASGKSVVDLISLFAVTIDFIARGIVSFPIGGWYNQEANKEIDTIEVICKTKVDGECDRARFLTVFQCKLDMVNDELKPEEKFTVVEHAGKAHLFSRQMECVDSKKKRTYAYAHLRLRRYMPFTQVLKALAKKNINTRLVAGQEHIQIRCVAEDGDPSLRQVSIDKAVSLAGAKALYRYQNFINKQQTFFVLDVHTRHLATVIQAIEQDPSLHVQCIHDY